VAAPVLAAPWVWTPKLAYAGPATRGLVKHLLYIRLSGGFRFTAAFNADVADEFNPFGVARNLPSGTEWSPSQLLESDAFLADAAGETRRGLGMQRVIEFANRIALVPCVDHEPGASSADGSHGSGLERYYTGLVGGDTSIFTMINYGLRDREPVNGNVALPAMSFGDSGMARGFGQYAAYRSPVIQGNGFEGFGFDAANALPAWAAPMDRMDESLQKRLHPSARAPVDAYIESRRATTQFANIFNDASLKVGDDSPDVVDGISNQQLNAMLGDRGAGRQLALALRLFRFGCPAAYINQGGYDHHSDEQDRLPDDMASLSHLISATRAALLRMTHPSGGSFWDHTLVVFGSEFGRTARGSRFNSARGSDHAGDLATRWMSMPMMGGVVDSTGAGGKQFGSTRRSDLSAAGPVYSYRSIVKTLLDLLGTDHAEFFPGDPPADDIFA